MILCIFSRYFCYVDLNETEQSIEEVKKDILQTSQHALGGTGSLLWPLGKDLLQTSQHALGGRESLIWPGRVSFGH